MDIFAKFAEAMDSLAAIDKLAIAVSGGIDSMVLMHLTHAWKSQRHQNVELFVLSVNHMLRKEAYLDIELIKKTSEILGIKCETFVLEEFNDSKSNLQARARIARYKVMSDWCKLNKVNYMLVGHQKNDNAENFFIRLERGSGLDGLSGMGKTTTINDIEVFRPLLDITREEIHEYAKAHDITWNEDRSNSNAKYKRVLFRNFIANQDNPSVLINRISHAMHLMREELQMAIYYTKKAADECMEITNTGSIKLYREKFSAFHEKTIARLIIYSLMGVGNKCYKPRHVATSRVLNDFISMKNVKKTLHGCKVVSTDRFIFIDREPAAIQDLVVKTSGKVVWDKRILCKVDVGLAGSIVLKPAGKIMTLPRDIRESYDGSTDSLPIAVDINGTFVYPMTSEKCTHVVPYIETSESPLLCKMESILCLKENIGLRSYFNEENA